MLCISVASYPNNEIRLRLAHPPRMRKDVLGASCLSGMSIDMAVAVVQAYQALVSPMIAACFPNLTLEANSKLGSKDADSGQKLKPGFGGRCRPTRFGLYAKRQLLRVGGAIDKTDALSFHGIFLTGTLPGSTHAAKQAIADWSGYIVHRLKAWIAKRVKAKFDFYVWELQKRGALHLHYYLYCPNAVVRHSIIRDFKAQWLRLLDKVSELSGIDLYKKSKHFTHAKNKEKVQAYAQEVEKSVAAYLSKYCSKDAGKQPSGKGSGYYPSRWWGASRPLLARLREITTKEVRYYSSTSNVRARFEDLLSMCESLSLKGYRYGDKVGSGQNYVFYTDRHDWQKATATVVLELTSRKPSTTLSFADYQHKKDKDMSLETKLDLKAVVVSQGKMIAALAKQDKLWLHFWENGSKSWRDNVLKLQNGDSLDHFQSYAVASETWALAAHCLNNYPYGEELMKRVVERCEIHCAWLSNRIAIQNEAERARTPKPKLKTQNQPKSA